MQEPTLLTNATLIDESREKTSTRAYSVARILQVDADLLAANLTAVAETIPELSEETPQIGRDRRDDYLLAHVVVGQADSLVSGGADPHSAGQMADVRVVSPAQFLTILRGAGQI